MSRPEFLVESLASDPPDRFTAVGRCGDEPIRVDDTFDAVYRYKPRRYPDELSDDPVRESEEPASLRVVCIHAYGRSLRVLGQGMTASIVLEGQGLDHVVAGWVLGKRGGSPAVVSGTSDRD